MTKGRKNKRAERGSLEVEEELSDAKRSNMAASEAGKNTESTENSEPSLTEIREMLANIQTSIANILKENKSVKTELTELKAAYQEQKRELESVKTFQWKNKKDKIKRAVIYQLPKEGGLHFINFATMVNSLRLAWISKFLSDTNDSWKAIPNYYFSDYGGLQFLLKCNYNVNFINKNIPIFYREL